ncbi:hypothetical protein OE88DRAFT_1740533 [Heliocybe sulcata]|uniref:Uncharacterized protein n=1 Tax=Heliocybe sulcata TaxID=5364 RepID=A0A5C3MJ02_9AGAM|nr:hypothetical protein OE88DRAFT_1740533 [Heliocybe sulcata]
MLIPAITAVWQYPPDSGGVARRCCAASVAPLHMLSIKFQVNSEAVRALRAPARPPHGPSALFDAALCAFPRSFCVFVPFNVEEVIEDRAAHDNLRLLEDQEVEGKKEDFPAGLDEIIESVDSPGEPVYETVAVMQKTQPPPPPLVPYRNLPCWERCLPRKYVIRATSDRSTMIKVELESTQTAQVVSTDALVDSGATSTGYIN